MFRNLCWKLAIPNLGGTDLWRLSKKKMSNYRKLGKKSGINLPNTGYEKVPLYGTLELYLIVGLHINLKYQITNKSGWKMSTELSKYQKSDCTTNSRSTKSTKRYQCSFIFGVAVSPNRLYYISPNCLYYMHRIINLNQKSYKSTNRY